MTARFATATGLLVGASLTTAAAAVADPGDSVTYTVSSDGPLMSVSHHDEMDNMLQVTDQPANWSTTFTSEALPVRRHSNSGVEGSPHRLRCASNSTCLARAWVARYTALTAHPSDLGHQRQARTDGGVAADSNFATLMSSPSRVGRCVGWKVFHKWARCRWPDCLPQLALWHCR